MADMNSIQVTDNSQNQSRIEPKVHKRTSRQITKSLRMEFGGRLCLQWNGFWMYYQRVGGKKIRKSTKETDYEKAVTVAKRMSSSYSMMCKVYGREYSDLYMKAFKNSKKNAKSRGIDFNLTDDHMRILIDRSKGRCELTGIVFQSISGLLSNERQPFIPSIDRIDSYKSYSLENCRLICVAANLAINTWGDWVLFEITKGMKSKHRSYFPTKLTNRTNGDRKKGKSIQDLRQHFVR